MAELLLSVLAGVASAAVWESVKWVLASVRAQKTRPTDDDQKAG